MKHTAKVLIIIVTWNKKEYVIDLLASLSNLNFPTEQIDLLVIDNASNDGTVEAIKKQFSDIHIIQNAENIGGTGGFNTGLAWAFEQEDSRYDYLWLLDNDVVVHNNALSELVTLLDNTPDAAVAGSTMMQLDYPSCINEMGAFVDKGRGALIFNRHFEEISSWQGKPVEELLSGSADLSQQLPNCQPYLDVDYVAAASLLIRADVAKKSGLWMDFFIHFDDVEWCLRIAEAGHRILVSAKSLIWHISAIAKVPSWILYYDNRNILYLLDKHAGKESVKNAINWSTKKALYYSILGKQDLAELHITAVEDYKQGIVGKKDIQLPYAAQALSQLGAAFSDSTVNKILIPWAINMQATKVQEILVKAMRERPELQVYYLTPPPSLKHEPQRQFPRAIPIAVPSFFLLRYFKYFRLRNQFDLTIQSDYQPILPLSWISNKNLFINDIDFCIRPKPCLKQVLKMLTYFYTSRKNTD